LINNSSFEEGTNNWSSSPSTAVFNVIDTFKHSGQYGALLTKTSSSGAASISQKVSVESGKFYRLSGWVLINDPYINNAKLRFYWLNESGLKILPEAVQIEETLKDSRFQFLETELSLAPENASSAEVQAYVYLEGNPENPAVFDDLIFEEISPSPTLPPPSPTPTLTPSLTPTPKPPSPTPTLKAVYKINKAKDENGEFLSSVKIYVDDNYTHHYDDEVLYFCSGCECYSGVDCSFGEHKISLEKDGYETWQEIRTFNPGDNFEVSPVLKLSQNPSLVSSPTFTPTPRPTITPTLVVTLTAASPSGILAAPDLEENEGSAEGTDSAEIKVLGAEDIKKDINIKPPESKFKKNFLSLGAIGLGGIMIAAAAFSFFKRSGRDKN